MARALICDVCKKPTERIVAKLYIAPVPEDKAPGVVTHSTYTGSADVGECCRHIVTTVHWNKRNPRRLDGRNAVASRKSATSRATLGK